ncbi:unnamed protein product [Orchesella dallaii]|uniref:ubiquitinyl hydrolase 1 n=1 Tax=Orchesella dallaii TaxID=48710 RepID=A0ABP1QVK9_9HEXA
MPVPDSYSRRYGREETSTYRSSYSTGGGTRSSYLSSYTSKQSTSLPPRPPLYSSDTYRKYGDSSSVTSRFLTSSSSSSRIRDYGTTAGAGGSSYRSSVSPVRATTSALRSSIADRIKAMEIDGKDDDMPVRSYTSRYSSLRNRDPVSSSLSGTRTYTSAYAPRDRSNSREYGTSPLSTSSSILSNSRERDTSLTRVSTENAKKRSSPSPTANSGSRKDSVGAVVNGTSTSEVNNTSSTSSSTSESATCASKGVATLVATSTTTNTKKPLVTTSCTTTTKDSDTTTVVNTVDNHDDVDVVDATTVIVSDSSCAYNQCARDLENNDVDCSLTSAPGNKESSLVSDDVTTNNVISHDEVTPKSNKSSSKSLGMVMMNKGNSSDDNGGKKDSNGVVVMVVQDRNIKSKVKSVPSSSSSALKDTVIGAPGSSSVVVDTSGGGGGDQALGTSSSTSASDTAFSSSTSIKVMEKDSNGNPIPMDTKALVDVVQDAIGTKNKYGKGSDEPRSTTSTTVRVTAASRGITRRRLESDSNANNLVETPPPGATNGHSEESCPQQNGDDSNKVSIQVNREPSPYESFTISKPRRSSAASANSAAAAATVAASMQNNTSPSSSPRSSASRVIYHTIKVEESKITKSPSPEPISFTVKAPPPSTSRSAGDSKQGEITKSSSTSQAPVAAETSADFKVSLPRRRSSTVKASDLPSSSTSAVTPSNENRHSNGNLDPTEAQELSNKLKMNSHLRQTESPSKSVVMSNNVRMHRKSGSPADRTVTNHRTSLRNEEDSSSSVEDEQSDHDKPLKPASNRSTPTRSIGTGTSPGINSIRKSKSKSPSPRLAVGNSTQNSVGNSSPGVSKYLNSEGSDNVNGFEMGGPHTSKFAYPSQVAETSSTLAANRNDRKSRYAHLTGASSAIASDSSDNDSDAFSSSPQLGGRFRSRDGNERAGLTGLRNIGNTCFMNTVLQCLSNTKPLLEYMNRENYQQDINTTTSGMKGCLIRAFAEVIQELWREQRVVDTSAFKDQIQKFAPRFMGYSQQDAQEFLRYLLEGLHEDVNRVTSKPTPILTDIDDSLSDSQKATEAWKRYLRYEDSRIMDIFVGQLRSTLKCTVCGNCSVTFDPFWDLSLPIPARTASTRLAQCFELFTKEEVLDGDEKPTCSKCQCRRKCTKSFSIQKFPRILVIHLKRFSPTERYRGKLSTLVESPISSLDLSPFAANRGQPLTYNLYGVANHSGSTYSGHYIAYCKHPYTGEWHSYNDSRVSPISTHQVVSTEGYVLFYEQA